MFPGSSILHSCFRYSSKTARYSVDSYKSMSKFEHLNSEVIVCSVRMAGMKWFFSSILIFLLIGKK